MGAWIEIMELHEEQITELRRTPRWVRGLKLLMAEGLELVARVAPHDGCVD